MTMNAILSFLRTRAGAVSLGLLLGMPALVLALSLLSSGAAPPTPASEAVPPPFLKEAVSGPPARIPIDRDTAWSNARKRIADAEIEAVLASGKRMDGVKAFFDARKDGARPFAEAVLGGEGKLVVAGTAYDELATAVSSLFGATQDGAPDRLTLYLRRNLERHILNPEQVKSALNEAVAGCIDDIKAVDAQLLVDLHADLGDEALASEAGPGSMQGEVGDSALFGRATGTIFEAAAEDMYVSAGKFAFSWWAGDAVAAPLTKGMNPVLRFGAGQAIGVPVDAAIDGVVKHVGGHDPEGKIVARVQLSLDVVRDRVIEGDPLAMDVHRHYETLADGHPNQAVRTASREAADAIERAANLGLQNRLFRRIRRHYEQARISIYKHIYGNKATVPADLLPPTVVDTDPESCQIFIDTAHSVTNMLKGVSQ